MKPALAILSVGGVAAAAGLFLYHRKKKVALETAVPVIEPTPPPAPIAPAPAPTSPIPSPVTTPKIPAPSAMETSIPIGPTATQPAPADETEPAPIPEPAPAPLPAPYSTTYQADTSLPVGPTATEEPDPTYSVPTTQYAMKTSDPYAAETTKLVMATKSGEGYATTWVCPDGMLVRKSNDGYHYCVVKAIRDKERYATDWVCPDDMTREKTHDGYYICV